MTLTGRLRLIFVMLPFAVLALALMPVQWLAIRMGWRLQRRLPVFFHRTAAHALGVRVIVEGTPSPERPLLLTPNHVSWLDIVVLSSILPVSFIAKAEVAQWPLFGTFARLQRSIFVDRARRSETAAVAERIASRMAGGDAIVLFAEGTSSDGNIVLPFRSALIGAARDAIGAGGGRAYVQPVAIAYTKVEGLPMGRQFRPLVSWVGSIDLVPHLLRVAAEGAVDVVVRFGTPIPFDPQSDRKQVAAAAERAVRRMMSAALRGRPLPEDAA